MTRLDPAFLEGIVPPPDLTVSAWAAEFYRIPQGKSPRAGQWDPDVAPYLGHIQDKCGADDPSEHVVLMWGSGLGKTEGIGMVWIAFTMAHDPAPMLVATPTIHDAEKLSKKRIAPMIAAIPEVCSQVANPRSRDTSNTLREKAFTGGTLTLVGSNAPSGLAGDHVKKLYADERDRFARSAGSEGDSFQLAYQRTVAYPDRKIVSTSTPTVEGESRIEDDFLDGDQERFFVPCPECGTMQVLMWAGFHIERDGDVVTGASYVCGGGAAAYAESYPASTVPGCDGEGCGVLIDEWQKTAMLRAGEWRATAVGKPGVTSSHLPSWYAPVGLGWSWARIAQRFVDAKGDPEQLQVVINTLFAETWKHEDGESLDELGLLARREPYGKREERLVEGLRPLVPAEAGVITWGVDVQGDRVEAFAWAWGPGEEAWLVDHLVIYGDPHDLDFWLTDVDDALGSVFEWPDGGQMPAVTGCIDTGYATDQVYDYVARRRQRRWWGIKGRQGDRPVWPKRPTRSKKKARIYDPFVVGTDSAKDALFDRLGKVDAPGPGYIHLPEWADRELVEQLTAEARVTVKRRGRTVRVYVLRPGRRNEALDGYVYALAALRGWLSMGMSLQRPRVAPAAGQAPSSTATSRGDVRREEWIPERKDWFR